MKVKIAEKRLFFNSFLLYVIYTFTFYCNSVAWATSPDSLDITAYVNPFIGSANQGNTNPGAVVPWGLAAVSPHTKDFRQQAKGPAVYEYGDPFIYGFGTVNLSGLGCPAAGSIPIKVSRGKFNSDVESTKSAYESEIAQPGYYQVYLKKHQIRVEATTTARTGIYRFSPSSSPETPVNIYLDLAANMSHVKGGSFQLESNRLVTGYQWDGAFCGTKGKRKIYFAMELQNIPDTILVVQQNKLTSATKLSGKVGVAFVYYPTDDKTNYQIRVGISFVSEKNALLNLREEQNGFNFNHTQSNALAQWKKQLSKIQVSGGSPDDKSTFYTALYHSLLLPQVFSDVNGEYPKMASDSIKVAQGYTRYTTYSLWDTYRTIHPLLTLLYPVQQRDMLTSMIEMYQESGWLPKWELFGNESAVMIGDPGVPVIVDSYRKGITDIDVYTAYQGMLKSATQRQNNVIRPGNMNYWKLGYIPIDDRGGNPEDFRFDNGIVWGPVSTTLEYNLADYSIAQLAKKLDDQKNYTTFYRQSHSFTEIYDPGTAFLRPKNKDGSWLTPFDPLDRFYDIRWEKSGGKGYVEGSAWQYRFFVPHAIDSLKQLMGVSNFAKYMNQLFEEEHFDMTNEPDISYPYLFNYVPGQEAKTHTLVNQLATKHFFNAADGLPGNDDAGTLSAWLVFSYLGFYPDVPGEPIYQLTTPRFKKVEIQLDDYVYNHKKIIIEKISEEGIVSRRVNRDSSSYPLGFTISHQELVSGTHLLFDNSLR